MASALQGTTTACRKDPVINKNPKVLRKKNHPIILVIIFSNMEPIKDISFKNEKHVLKIICLVYTNNKCKKL